MNSIYLPDDQIEKLIVNKYYNDVNYRTLIEDYCNHKKYYSNSNIFVILSILIKYYRTYKKMPERSVLESILEKFSQLKSSVNLIVLKSTLDMCLADTVVDEALIKDNILYFIKNKNIYHAVLSSLDDLEKKQDISSIMEAFKKVDRINIDQDLGLEYFKDLNKHIDYLANPESKISTGYKQLDYYTNGGYMRDGKCLIVFLGQPGLGKSLMLGNHAVNFIKQGLNAVIISMELHEQFYAQRISAHLSKLDVNALRFNLDEAKKRINKFSESEKTGKLLIKEFPPNSVNSNIIQQYLEKIIATKFKPDVVLIDYLNLVRPNYAGKKDSIYERIGETSKDLRSLSYLFKIPVITASQINRGGYYSNEVGLDNISDSSGIAFTADFIGAMWQADGDREANKMSITILKNRLGGHEGKVIEFFINYNNLLIQDMSEIGINISEKSSIDNLLENL